MEMERERGILQVECVPVAGAAADTTDPTDFEIHLNRYSYRAGEWEMRTNVKAGYLELKDVEKDFPKETDFP